VAHLLRRFCAMTWLAPYGLVRVAVAFLLLFAATAKLQQVATTLPGVSWDMSSAWPTLHFVLEAALGAWLLSGARQRASSVVATIIFVVYCGTSAYRALRGDQGCGCFGEIRVNPWTVLLLDSVILAALCLCRPSTDNRVQPRHIWTSVGALGSLAGLYVVLAAVSPSTLAANLKVDAAALDLGEVWGQSDLRTTLPVRNHSATPISIIGFNLSCGCTQVSPTAAVVPPGASVDFQVVVDLRAKQSKGPALPKQSFSVHVQPIVAAAEGRHSGWELTGVVRSTIVDVPRVLPLGQIAPEDAETRQQVMALTAVAPVASLDVRCNSPIIEVAIARDSDDDDARFRVAVRLQPGAPVGAFRVPIELFPRTATGDRLPPYSVLAVGEVLGNVYITPDALVLGAIPVGEVSVRSIAIVGRTPFPFDVSIDHCPSDAIHLIEDTAAPTAHRYRVECIPKVAGGAAARIRFRVVTRDGAIEVHDLPVQYYGVTQQLPVALAR
jgi:Protein of unknown function (DUF1573)